MSLEDAVNRLAAAIEANGISPKIAAASAVGAPKPASKPPGRPRKTGGPTPEDEAAAKLRADAQAQVDAEDAADADPLADEIDDGTITKEKVATVLGQLVDANQRETVVKLLAKYGAKSISSLPEKAYEAVYAAASALL